MYIVQCTLVQRKEKTKKTQKLMWYIERHWYTLAMLMLDVLYVANSSAVEREYRKKIKPSILQPCIFVYQARKWFFVFAILFNGQSGGGSTTPYHTSDVVPLCMSMCMCMRFLFTFKLYSSTVMTLPVFFALMIRFILCAEIEGEKKKLYATVDVER